MTKRVLRGTSPTLLLLIVMIGAVAGSDRALADADPATKRGIVERAVARIEDRLGGLGLRRFPPSTTFLKMRPGMAVADGRALFQSSEPTISREIPKLQDQWIRGTTMRQYVQTGVQKLTQAAQNVTIFISDQWQPPMRGWKDLPARREHSEIQRSPTHRTLLTRGQFPMNRGAQFDSKTVRSRAVTIDRAIRVHGFPGRLEGRWSEGQRVEQLSTIETQVVAENRFVLFTGFLMVETPELTLGISVHTTEAQRTWVPAMTEAQYMSLLEMIASAVASELPGAGPQPDQPAPDVEPAPEVAQPQVDSIVIFDVNPLFTGGMPLEALDSPEAILRHVKERRVGVSADGVSQVLLRVQVQKPGQVTLRLGEELGTLEVLFGGRTFADRDKHYAFARYAPPKSFPGAVRARSDDPRLGGVVAYHEVPVTARYTPSEPGTQPVEETLRLKLVRPPVLLVHGTFDNPTDCWTVNAPETDARHGTESMVDALLGAGFFPFLVDFTRTNGSTLGDDDQSSFAHNRRVLWANPGGIYDALREYREALDVAATQVDVVGHSLGGLIPRLWASEGYNPRGSAGATGFSRDGVVGYRRVDNFEAGDIHRLITLCTPHLGSDLGHLAAVFQATPAPLRKRMFTGPIESVALFLARLFAGYDVTDVVRDQFPHLPTMPNGALQRIGATPVPSHAVVCWARLTDLEDFGGSYKMLPEWGFWWLLDERAEVVEAFLRARGQERDLERILGEANTLGWLLRNAEGDVTDPLQAPIDIKDKAVLHNLLRAAIFGNTQNDLVVRVESQTGGLLQKHTTPIEGVLHSFAPRYGRVQQAVLRLLGESERDFDPRGFPAPRYLGNVEPFEAQQDPAARAKAVAASGYVPSHAEAISLIAMQENVVILARPVNRNATALIAAHNATKDMHVKGKSASWGPQKGFIPVEQRFSKLHFAKQDRKKQIEKYDGEVEKCLRTQRAQEKPLVVQVGGVSCAVLVVKGIEDPERAIVLKAQEGGTYHGWKNGPLATFDAANPPGALEVPAAEIERRGTKPLMVLADRNSGKLLTADYDMLAFATRFNPRPPLNDPEMGGICPYQIELIQKINNEVRIRTNYIGGDVTHHGPEVLFDKSPGADYPITAFEPSGYIISIREGRKGRSDYWLKRYFHHLKARGWIIEPNHAAWRWGDYDPTKWPGIGYFPDDRPKPEDSPDNAFDSDEGDEAPLALPAGQGEGGR